MQGLRTTMLAFRRLLRGTLPLSVRWRLRLWSRYASDFLARRRFASGHGDRGEFPYRVCQYERPHICYPGQERQFAGKRNNTELVLAMVDGLVIEPGETFSFWHTVGRPTAAAGFLRAAALKNRRLIEDIGGAICLPSTLLYNAGLLSGMTVVERHCHSVDSYREKRYFELGRDAAVEYPYRDLRLRNDLPVTLALRCWVKAESIAAEVWSAEPLPLTVHMDVSEPVHAHPTTIVVRDEGLPTGDVIIDDPGLTGVSVRTRRTISLNGACRCEDLGLSVHHMVPRRERHGAQPGTRP